MIVTFFLGILYAVVTFMANLLPTITIPVGFLDSLNLFWGFINQFSFLFPLSTLLTCLGIVFTYYVTIFLFDVSLWLIHLIRGR